eukprot:TRINITY_DN5682_c0_g1_i1.p1 TRINITY_DN5682_c0_g1~~TRINITY_DN5682_c0_g1_i1.p1  ORF type:complete len:130 (+),score=7.10 TRINITY_DN5682_c0_g1_i1:20-409(+)
MNKHKKIQDMHLIKNSATLKRTLSMLTLLMLQVYIILIFILLMVIFFALLFFLSYISEQGVEATLRLQNGLRLMVPSSTVGDWLSGSGIGKSSSSCAITSITNPAVLCSSSSLSLVRLSVALITPLPCF